MKTRTVILSVAIGSLALCVIVGATGSHSLRRRAASIHSGDTKAQVIAALGPATDIVPTPRATPNVSLGFPQPVSWCYGKKFDWHLSLSRRFPFIVEIVDRSWSFYPWARDIVVEFDRAGRVVSVQLPKSRASSNHSLQAMPVGRFSSAFAADITGPAWLSSSR